MNFLNSFIFRDIFYFQTVCETIISYQNKAISKISKKCDTASLCERIRDGSSSLCRSSARTPYCVYCCDTQLCNEEIEVLEFKGNAMDFNPFKPTGKFLLLSIGPVHFFFKGCWVVFLRCSSLKVILWILTLNAPMATKVVCFSRLLKCLRSLYDKQCGPRSDCSYIGSLCLLLYLICQ